MEQPGAATRRLPPSGRRSSLSRRNVTALVGMALVGAVIVAVAVWSVLAVAAGDDAVTPEPLLAVTSTGSGHLGWDVADALWSTADGRTWTRLDHVPLEAATLGLCPDGYRCEGADLGPVPQVPLFRALERLTPLAAIDGQVVIERSVVYRYVDAEGGVLPAMLQVAAETDPCFAALIGAAAIDRAVTTSYSANDFANPVVALDCDGRRTAVALADHLAPDEIERIVFGAVADRWLVSSAGEWSRLDDVPHTVTDTPLGDQTRAPGPAPLLVAGERLWSDRMGTLVVSDDGRRWSTVDVPGDPGWIVRPVAVGGDGLAVTVCPGFATDRRCVAHLSTDGGATWSPPVAIGLAPVVAAGPVGLVVRLAPIDAARYEVTEPIGPQGAVVLHGPDGAVVGVPLALEGVTAQPQFVVDGGAAALLTWVATEDPNRFAFRYQEVGRDS